MTTLVWVDGRVGDERTATVHALDHGLTVGDGVFETCHVRDGEAFAMSRHLRRLAGCGWRAKWLRGRQRIGRHECLGRSVG